LLIKNFQQGINWWIFILRFRAPVCSRNAINQLVTNFVYAHPLGNRTNGRWWYIMKALVDIMHASKGYEFLIFRSVVVKKLINDDEDDDI